MPSVAAVSLPEFRANLSQPQNPAPEGDEPFSLLLNSITDVKAGAQRPEAPRAPERRADAPAKQPKPETDTERQAKRRAPEAEKPEGKMQTEAAAPANAVGEDHAGEETDADAENTETDALLMLALTEPQQQAAGPTQNASETDVPAASAPAQSTAVPSGTDVPEAGAATMAAGVAATATGADAEAEAQTASPPAAPGKPQPAAATAEGQAEAETVIPKISTETLAEAVKPLKATASSSAHTPPAAEMQDAASAEVPVRQGPAQLELLNAALNKQLQLTLAADAGEPDHDPQKPLFSSNAVAPNFALNLQSNAAANLQTQQAAAAAPRAVPLEQLAVEIATRAGKGERRFDIRLDPPELGRIDVRLEIDSKGNTTTKLIVERAETLDMLQRDARGLEKALQNAGLKTDAGGMQFSLQQDAQTHEGHPNHLPPPRGFEQAEVQIVTEIAAGNASLAAQLRGGVDIRI